MKSLGRFVLLFLLSVIAISAFATHYRAGEILYTYMGGYTYQATVITYTKISGVSIGADRDTVDINWGDGTIDVIPRVNGPTNGSGYPNGVLVLTDVKKNEYVGTHTYPGKPPNGFYIISFFDNNRLDGIANIANGNSVEIPFYVEDTLFFPTSNDLIGQFSSPVLVNPAVQYAGLCDTFITNPEAVDSAADSITYVLVPCLQSQGNDVPQFIFWGAFCNNIGGGGCVPNNTLAIDFHTGNLTWTEPCEQGFFNVGILLHIYRHGICIGTMLRDFQVIVIEISDHPPQIHIPADTCVRAGDVLFDLIKGNDPNPGSGLINPQLTLSAEGDPFIVPVSPAVFDTTVGWPTVTGTFHWQTVCNDIQVQPFYTYFKVEDNFQAYGPDGNLDPFHLADYATWRIYVIPPPVQGLTATTTHLGVVLNWKSPYICDSAPDFRGFSVWRKAGCDPFIPAYCETGLAGTGYVKISAYNTTAYTYTDNTVVAGQAYSYRILAEFYSVPPNGDTILAYAFQESVPSAEVCVNAPADVPVILNADVMQTDPLNGQIWVRWFKPLAGGTNLDTIADTPQYRFDLYRGTGFNFGTPLTLIKTWIYNSYSAIPDTTSTIDSGINTVTGPWSYKLYFYAANNQPVIDTVGTSASASSIFLTIQPSDSSLYLHWNYNVPWSNDSFSVFRQSHITGIFDSIGMAYYTNLYIDTGLDNDTTYCYFIRGFGAYTALSNPYPFPLMNRSERTCNAPVDTVPPCPPVLTVTNDCGNYTNQPWNTTQYVNHLSWHLTSDSCDINLQYFNIYFSSTDSNKYVLIDSLVPKTDTTYNHVLDNSLAGCYAVTAVSRAGFESKFSNVVCIDNCPYYVLPNAFTPNGDGHNDLFHPFLPFRFVPRIDMEIFNRWGELVFETHDPMINWDGNDLHGKPVSEGVYLYAGYYYEQHLNGLARKPLSGEKKGGGFIQLIRK